MNNLKRKLLSFLACMVCCFTTLGSCLVTTYASNEPEAPEGYYLYKKVPLSDGTIQYIYISEDYKSKDVKLGEYDTSNTALSMSPQMTYSLYGVGDSSLEEDAFEDALVAYATNKKIDIADITTDMMKEVLMDCIDGSSVYSNAFAYSGEPDEDSFAVTAIDDTHLSGFSAYANYWVCDRAGIADWYVFVSNALSWHNTYHSNYFNNYDGDLATFCLLNVDNANFNGANLRTQYCTSRWYQDNVCVSDYHRVLFQTTAQSIITSGCLVFDLFSAEANAKVPAKTLIANLIGGSFTDVFGYSDYAKLHATEEEPINNDNIDAPVVGAVISDNKVTFSLSDLNYGSGHFGYYVDYLVYDDNSRMNNYGFGGGAYKIYRHYFFPSDSVVDGKTEFTINYNSLETQLPFVNCSLDGTVDNTLILGIGFYEYWTENGEIADKAPTRTTTLGDILYTSAYKYYTFKYPFNHIEHDKYVYDLKSSSSETIPCISIIWDSETNTIVSKNTDDTTSYSYDGGLGSTYTDFGYYVDYSDDGYTTTIINNTYINNWNTTINESNLSDDDKVILTDLNNNNNSSSDSGSSVPESGYFNRWSEWIVEMRNFIINVPELLKYLWSWLPNELQVFIVASIATGFGVVVVKNILHKE